MTGERHEDSRRKCISRLPEMQGQGPSHKDSDIELSEAHFRKDGNLFSVAYKDMAGGQAIFLECHRKH